MIGLNTIINDWLDRISKFECLPDSIKAIYIGLVTGADGYFLYMIGANEYDPDCQDWACEEDYTPPEKYCYTNINTEVVGWQEFNNSVVGIVKEYKSNSPDSILMKLIM